MFLEHRYQCNTVENLADCQYGSLVFTIYLIHTAVSKEPTVIVHRLFILISPSEIDFKALCTYFIEIKSHASCTSPEKYVSLLKYFLHILINYPEKKH